MRQIAYSRIEQLSYESFLNYWHPNILINYKILKKIDQFNNYKYSKNNEMRNSLNFISER
jgi:hypothetical protein